MEITDEELRAAEARGEEIHRKGHAVAARYDREARRVVIELHNGLEVSFSPEIHQDLAGASHDDLSEIELWGAGLDVHWPRLDGDVYVPSLMAGSFGTRAWMALHLGRTGEKPSSAEFLLSSQESLDVERDPAPLRSAGLSADQGEEP